MAKKDYIISFSKPYTFEGTEYKEIDLSGLEDLTSEDLENADSQFSMSGKFDAMRESSTAYCMLLSATATKKPIEFFKKLGAKDTVKIKMVVSNFLLV